MRYRALGKTGLKVSVLGYGGSALGGVFGPVDSGECMRAVRGALAGGINLFDVAPFYGATKAEEELGKALEGVAREHYILSTKVGRYGREEFDFSTKRVLASVDESLRRLKTDYVDLIHCHDVEFGELDQVVNETLPALHKLKKSGKVRFAGITGYPLKVFWYAIDRMDVDVVLTYGHYSLYDTTLTELLPYLKDKKVGVINAAALGIGLFSPPPSKPLPKWHPAPEVLRAACLAAGEACAKRGYSIAALAVKFSVDRAELASTLVGMGTVLEVEENIAAIEKAPPAGLLKEVEKILAPVKNCVWVSGRRENN
jgi:L-galactose dehydrogenase